MSFSNFEVAYCVGWILYLGFLALLVLGLVHPTWSVSMHCFAWALGLCWLQALLFGCAALKEEDDFFTIGGRTWTYFTSAFDLGVGVLIARFVAVHPQP